MATRLGARRPVSLAAVLQGSTPRKVLGNLAFLLFWHLASAVLKLPRFEKVPGPLFVFQEWLSPKPLFGISLFTVEYYQHILASTARVYAAFGLAVVLGVPLGIIMGWSQTSRRLLFPVVEALRPIPPLAWVPLAILLLPGTEPAVIFVTFLSAFFATTLNALLGVQQIDPAYFKAAACLGASRWALLRDVAIPGALPQVFTGLEIAMGLSWFAIVAGEMIAGQQGLGFLIFAGFSTVQYQNILIGMLTLGIVGYASSAAVRRIGDSLLRWYTAR
jgi:NitT/TauT family transport system permease protein